jgi:methyltransferase-like protein
MKKEEDSAAALDTSKLKMHRNISKSDAFDPFEELNIQPNRSDPADRE